MANKNMSSEKSRALVEVEVSQLLGRFDHRVPFAADKSFVILHGPNGVGKTRLLELIDATFSMAIYRLAQIPFRAALFKFEDGSILEVERTGQEAIPGMGEDESLAGEIRVNLTQPGGRKISWDASGAIGRSEVPAQIMRVMERELPIRRMAVDKWRDLSVGDLVSAGELYHRYADLLPRTSVNLAPDDLPTEITELLSGTSIHLIETQRLLNFESASQGRSPRESERGRRPTVIEFSEDFSRLLGEALALNSRSSQELDRTFPRRILSQELPDSEITEERIRERYSEQSETRRRLTEISVLDASGELPLPDRSLEDWERRVLWMYLDDAQKKLSTFRDLLDRVALLREIVNSRFLYKNLVLDRDGFHIVTTTGREVRPDKLSSGEQHELVLAYDLLFNAKPNSLVLIDEPEISLHVVWQKEFLNDIARISAINSARFMVATHSPQIINKYWSETVGLEAGYDNEDLWV
ncbi:AAA family ATPase [Kitasatospora sp. NPDC004531]